VSSALVVAAGCAPTLERGQSRHTAGLQIRLHAFAVKWTGLVRRESSRASAAYGGPAYSSRRRGDRRSAACLYAGRRFEA